jgi:hypothetical protein
MDKERQEEIIKLLTGKGAILPCPRCHNPQFELIGKTSIPVGEEQKGALSGATYAPKMPVIILACNHCGYLTYHAEAILDPNVRTKLSR